MSQKQEAGLQVLNRVLEGAVVLGVHRETLKRLCRERKGREGQGKPFEEKMARLTEKLQEQFAESAGLEAAIHQNRRELGVWILPLWSFVCMPSSARSRGGPARTMSVGCWRPEKWSRSILMTSLIQSGQSRRRLPRATHVEDYHDHVGGDGRGQR